MVHIKMPKKIIKRTNRYYNCIWYKFKGIEDSEILENIPETLNNEILFDMLRK